MTAGEDHQDQTEQSVLKELGVVIIKLGLIGMALWITTYAVSWSLFGGLP